jgi:hypothetical protein
MYWVNHHLHREMWERVHASSTGMNLWRISMESTGRQDLQVVDPSLSGRLLVHILSPSDIVCDTSPYVAINTEIPKLRNLIFI